MLYFFDTLPVHPPPQTLEAFTSLIPRLSVANGIQSVERMSALSFPSQTVRLRTFADYPLLSFEELPNLSACSLETLRATTFYYLVDLFGRSTHPQHASRFLGDTIAESLRYCPICVRERPWYILPWRFNVLTGCVIHCCRLRERCPTCAQVIPLLSSPLRIGHCPSCYADLTLGDVEVLSPDEFAMVQQRYSDLEYLLQPRVINADASDRPRMIGTQLAARRSEQSLSLKSTAANIGITADTLSRLEWGTAKKAGLPFATYVKYADILNISLSTVIQSAYSDQQPHINIQLDSLGRRRAVYFNGASRSSI